MRIFYNDFRSGDLSAWTSWTATPDMAYLDVIQNPNTGRSSYALRSEVLLTRNWAGAYVVRDLGATYRRLNQKVSLLLQSFNPGLDGEVRSFIRNSGVDLVTAFLGLTTARQLKLMCWHNGAYYTIRSSRTIEIGQRYDIELETIVDSGAGDGQARVYVNDVEVPDLSTTGLIQDSRNILRSIVVGLITWNVAGVMICDEVEAADTKITPPPTPRTLGVISRPWSGHSFLFERVM